jgi:tetratricopeptide (TPR) repeat protein
VLPAGVTFALASSSWELREAEGFLRRAIEIKPDYSEARLRLGRVQGLLGRHAAAAKELREALASADEDLLRYYGELFLGAEEEALGRYDAAFDAYQQAAALYPTAQSPLLALSSLARRRGDRAGVLGALQQLFALPVEKPDRDDPWWAYHVEQARHADELLEQLCRPFRTGREP